MKFSIAILFGLLCNVANAQGVTALLGATQFTPHGDGVWYQEAFPYKLDLTSPSVGLRYDTAQRGGWSYGAGYMHLGKVRTEALATAVEGDQIKGTYNPTTKSCYGGECMPLSHWYGSGSVQGVFAVATKHAGPWSVDAGLYVYKPAWRMQVPDWIGCIDCAPQPIEVGSKGWNIGPMFGMRYKVERWSVVGSAWYTKARGEFPAIYNNFTFNLSTGYTF